MSKLQNCKNWFHDRPNNAIIILQRQNKCTCILANSTPLQPPQLPTKQQHSLFLIICKKIRQTTQTTQNINKIKQTNQSNRSNKQTNSKPISNINQYRLYIKYNNNCNEYALKFNQTYYKQTNQSIELQNK